jgi:hypothetical protein
MNRKAAAPFYMIGIALALMGSAALLFAFVGPNGVLHDTWDSVVDILDFSFDSTTKSKTDIIYDEERIPEDVVIDIMQVSYSSDPYVTEEEITVVEEGLLMSGLNYAGPSGDIIYSYINRIHEGWQLVVITDNGPEEFFITARLDVLLDAPELLGWIELDDVVYVHAPRMDGLSLAIDPDRERIGDEDERRSVYYWYIDANGNLEHDPDEGVIRLYSQEGEDSFWYVDINNDLEYYVAIDELVSEDVFWYKNEDANLAYNPADEYYDVGDSVTLEKVTYQVLNYGGFSKHRYIDDGKVFIVKQASGKGWNLEYDQEDIKREDIWWMPYQTPASCDPGSDASFTDNCILLKETDLVTILSSENLRGSIKIDGDVYVHLPLDADGGFLWFINGDDKQNDYNAAEDKRVTAEQVANAILEEYYKEAIA